MKKCKDKDGKMARSHKYTFESITPSVNIEIHRLSPQRQKKCNVM